MDEHKLRTFRWMYSTIQGLIDNGGLGQIEIQDNPAETTIVVWLAKEDIGKVIGKQGRTARAIRFLLYARGMKEGVRYSLDLRRVNDQPESLPSPLLDSLFGRGAREALLGPQFDSNSIDDARNRVL